MIQGIAELILLNLPELDEAVIGVSKLGEATVDLCAEVNVLLFVRPPEPEMDRDISLATDIEPRAVPVMSIIGKQPAESRGMRLPGWRPGLL